ncbi:hypothetical protein N7532_008333 [Penicillium argentinense]|uniref:Uncharacterized protein n=1 Tax=Penicillium argentinense TaxID=1131581 RepID=A0A9W9EXE4_9EURO|nr:uncharacterized protein N7532_008333 [Penicillium argentinense]KAJ5089649.1 hypothetical protein N7532_008333 [Penicillium argentinense]
MASWPGVLSSRAALTPLSGHSWSTTRSEIYASSDGSSLQGSCLDEDRQLWRAPSSTVSGTLQPLSSRLSEESPPRTTSTASMVGNPAEGSSKSHDAGLSPRVWDSNETQQFTSLAPSQHFNDSRHVPDVVRDNSANLVILLDEVVAILQDVSNQRFVVRHLRDSLRQAREEEDELRLALRNKLNLTGPEAVHVDATPINKVIEDLQAATTSYLALEKRYLKTEEGLGETEYSLDKCMRELTKVLRQQGTHLTQQQQPDSETKYDSSVASTSTGNVGPLSPEVSGYCCLVGEVHMHRENLGALEAEYLSLIDQQQRRERVGLTLDQDGSSFLDRYEGDKAAIEGELRATLQRLEEHPQHRTRAENVVSDEQWRDVLRDYLPEMPEDQPPPDPLRASELDDRSPFFESARPIPLNKSNFVNHWLLYRLRHSAVEIMRFKSQPKLLNLVEEGWDRDRISQMAMMLWYRDETTQLESARSNSAGY